MAILDLSGAQQAIDMAEPGLVGFGSYVATSQTQWHWLTLNQHQVNAFGGGLTFDSEGRATGGTITAIGLDLGSDDPGGSEITITDISVPAAPLDDSADSFWNVLSGDDSIIGPAAANLTTVASSNVFGDGISARAGASAGGNDAFDTGDAGISIQGDVVFVGGGADSPAAEYQGGDDTISGRATAYSQSAMGDACEVNHNGKLTGGDDYMIFRSAYAYLGGDAYRVSGIAGDIGEVYGGDDTLLLNPNSLATMAGDVMLQASNTFVQGGYDTLISGNQADLLAGDVFTLEGGGLRGGNDYFAGNLGDDVMAGDAYFAYGGTLTGGQDFMHGGGGNDRIYGETTDAGSATIIGGNDGLYGGDGNDMLHGQGGNDLLDGGAGIDEMHGGAGNDDYVVDQSGDLVIELAGQGIDTVRTTLSSLQLAANAENLIYIGNMSLKALGNALNNVITGSANSDSLLGEDGNDRLEGLGGNDYLVGGNGNDTLDGGIGGDDLIGGLGDDGYHVNTSADVVSEAAGGGFDTIFAMTSYTMAANAERLYLAGTGNYNANGRNGQNDFLAGNSGNNIINGLSGNDVIRGGLGNDTLTGGPGQDVYQFLTVPNTAANRDMITDFSIADDTIQLDNLVYTLLGADGALAANLFKNLLTAQDADDRILYDQTNGNLYYDTNGLTAGGVVHFAEVTNGLALSAADFVVV